jgi:hypothetical protein
LVQESGLGGETFALTHFENDTSDATDITAMCATPDLDTMHFHQMQPAGNSVYVTHPQGIMGWGQASSSRIHSAIMGRKLASDFPSRPTAITAAPAGIPATTTDTSVIVKHRQAIMGWDMFLHHELVKPFWAGNNFFRREALPWQINQLVAQCVPIVKTLWEEDKCFQHAHVHPFRQV